MYNLETAESLSADKKRQPTRQTEQPEVTSQLWAPARKPSYSNAGGTAGVDTSKSFFFFLSQTQEMGADTSPKRCVRVT